MEEHVGMCVVGTWNNTGYMFVLVDKESAYGLVDAYEQHRLHHNLPWVTVKEAVDGYGILEKVKDGLFPWVVVFKMGGVADVQNVKAVPIQHCVKEHEAELGTDGKISRMTVWARDEYEASTVARAKWAEEYGIDLSKIGQFGDENFY